MFYLSALHQALEIEGDNVQPVHTGALEAVEHWQEDVGSHGGAEEVGEVDHYELSAVSVVLHRHPQQGYGGHEAGHQRESNRQHRGLLVSQQIFLVCFLFTSAESASIIGMRIY